MSPARRALFALSLNLDSEPLEASEAPALASPWTRTPKAAQGKLGPLVAELGAENADAEEVQA